MHFYPRTLKRDWYMAEVCDYIFASLEGTKKWTSYYFENKVERDAYVETFAQCQKIVKDNDMKPKAMLQALSDFHDMLTTIPKPPFFSITRWFYEPLKAREKAIIAAFELVDSIQNRFLP